ncbi:MAG: cytochrome c [Bdellovibrionota bacterium]
MSSEQDSYNKGGMVTFMLSMIASMGILIYVSFFAGIDLKETKQEEAGQVAPIAAEAAKKVDVSGVKDPWNPSDDMVAHGKQLFTTNCAMCHGASGKGDGPAGASLNPKPRNLVEGQWKFGGTRLGLFGVLHDGIKGTSMQAYKHMPPVDRWALVHYVRTVTENKVEDNDADVAAKAPSLQ